MNRDVSYLPEVETPTDQEPRGDRIYVSGPMRGMPSLNHAAFDGVSDMLLESGWAVHSPAAMDREHGYDNATPYSVTIRKDVEALLDADAICLLPGWRNSEGARFEAEIARSLGLRFYEAFPIEPSLGYKSEWVYRPVETPSEIGVEGIDQEARRLVYGERAATYGHPRGDFAIIAKIWTGLLMPILREGEEVSPDLVALMMSGLKLGRLAKTPTHRDSQVDAIGYLLCLARLQDDPAELSAWDNRSAA